MTPLPDQVLALGTAAAGAFETVVELFSLLMAALIATLAAGPVVRRIAVSYSLYDRPDAGLKPHEKPIPFLGGLALYVGWLAAILLGLIFHPVLNTESIWIALGGSVLLLTGLIDDIRHLRPMSRLTIQTLVAITLLPAGVGQGVAVSLSGSIFPPWGDALFGGWVGFCLDALFCVLVLAGSVNATNLIDGLDGLCSGIVAITAIGFLAVFALLGQGLIDAPTALLVPIVSIGILGACLAFLKFNFNPASLFMGDSGSMLLGFSVAIVIILMTRLASWHGFIASVTVFGFPIFDTALAIGRRRLNRRPLFIGDRSHFYDQIRDRGLTVRKTVLACYGLGLVFAVVGAAMTCLPGLVLAPFGMAIALIAILLCRRYGFLRVDDSAERSATSQK